MKSLYKKWCQKPRRECWSTERTEHPIWTPGFTDLLHICLDIKVVLRQGFGSQDKIITQLHHSYLKRELSDTFDALILNIYSREVKWIVDWFQMEIDNWQATQVLSINAIYRYKRCCICWYINIHNLNLSQMLSRYYTNKTMTSTSFSIICEVV